nr:TPA_exp: polyprotein [Danio rerio]
MEKHQTLSTTTSSSNNNNNNNNLHQANESGAILETSAEDQHQLTQSGNQLEPEATVRGRRPIRSTATRLSRRLQSSSPYATNLHPPSPASSYASATSSPTINRNMTANELRQSITDAGISIPSRCNKTELLKLYTSITSSTPPTRNSRNTRSRHAPYPQHSASPPASNQPGPRKATGKTKNTKKPQAQHHQDNRSFTGTTSNQTKDNNPDINATQQNNATFFWPQAPQSSATPSPHLSATNPLQFSLPSNLPSTSTNLIHSHEPTNISTNAPLHSSSFSPSNIPSFMPSSSLHQALASNTNPPPHPPLPTNISSTHPPFTLATAVPLPIPQNAPALEPPPVSNTIRNLIISGADIDLSTLLSPIAPPTAERQIDCGEFALILKPSTSSQTRTLSLAEFHVAFSRYTEVICSVFPHRRRELNDYMAIISELALSYGGTHFYTYHKLFSAKCAIRVSQWNQIQYWGAIDFDLHNRVFLGCRNLSCAVCRFSLHSTTSCPFVIPPSDTVPPNPRSTSYVPRTSTSAIPALLPSQSSSRNQSSHNPCFNFNSGRCYRHPCKFLHICNYCGGAHARIVCQVQKANKKSKQYLSTPVNISQLAHELSLHPDSNFSDFLITGLSNGFHPGVSTLPSYNLACPNLMSATAEPEVVDQLIKKEIDNNFMIGPFLAPPFRVYRISPIGIATRKFSGKKRLIIDLSSPHNSCFSSINSIIPPEEYALNYHDIDQAISLIKLVGRNAWLAKVDISSAFKVMPLHPDYWHLFGINWRSKFYFAVRLTFGCRSSPKIFDMLSEAICWILSNNYGIAHILHLLDDFLIISPPSNPATEHLTITKTVFDNLGIPLAEEKTSGPGTSLEFLGIKLDSNKFQASLPKEKIDRIIALSSIFLENQNCSKRELLSILGHLNFAMRIIPQGRPFVTHLLQLAASVPGLDDSLSLSDQCRHELSLWISFLKCWNGCSFFYSDLIESPIDIQLYTDAAPSIGFGGYYQGRWFASSWPHQMIEIPPHHQSSALFELYPLVAASILWGDEWSASSILVHCDNEAVVQCINKRRSHSPALMPLLRRLIWTSAKKQFIITAKHVPGFHNQIADSLSRFLFQKFRMLAPEADLHPHPVPPYSEMIFL